VSGGNKKDRGKKNQKAAKKDKEKAKEAKNKKKEMKKIGRIFTLGRSSQHGHPVYRFTEKNRGEGGLAPLKGWKRRKSDKKKKTELPDQIKRKKTEKKTRMGVYTGDLGYI